MPEETSILAGIVHEVPEDIASMLKADASLREQWNRLTPIQRNEWICWVTIVKQPETRASHLHRMAEEIHQGKRTPCCWPGCPHRKASAAKWFTRRNDENES